MGRKSSHPTQPQWVGITSPLPHLFGHYFSLDNTTKLLIAYFSWPRIQFGDFPLLQCAIHFRAVCSTTCIHCSRTPTGRMTAFGSDRSAKYHGNDLVCLATFLCHIKHVTNVRTTRPAFYPAQRASSLLLYAAQINRDDASSFSCSNWPGSSNSHWLLLTQSCP